MKKNFFTLFITLLFIESSYAQQNCGCDYHVPDTWLVDGNTFGAGGGVIKPGETICLDSSVDYKRMTWRNIVGTVADPIIIKNCGGQAYINSHRSITPNSVGNPNNVNHGWVFENSSFFKIKGDGDPQSQFGIKVSSPGGYYIKMSKFTTNFEISNVEVAGLYPGGTDPLSGFAGIGIKTAPLCDSSADRGTWEMRDIKVHHNYIHDVGAEGLYIGYGFYSGRLHGGNTCSLKMDYPHAINGLRVFNNRIENVGWDGIQVKNADSDVEIYNNSIVNYGTKNNGNHNEGLLVGDGSEALIYNNWIENGSGNGIQINAFGNTKIFNNTVVNSGHDSLYLNNTSSNFSRKYDQAGNVIGEFDIYNNTFIGAGHNGITMFTEQNKNLVNNIVGDYGNRGLHFNATLIHPVSFSNIFSLHLSALRFVALQHDDYHLRHNSPATGAGSYIPLNIDFDNSLRVDGIYDIGAFEYDVTVGGTNQTSISIITPSSNIQVSANDSVFIEVVSNDTSNRVQKVQYILNGTLIGTDHFPKKTEHWIGAQRLNQGQNYFYAIAVNYGGSIAAQSQTIEIFK
ncbi:MAG: hypothetical protein JKX90_00085 [Colwellia sp.]|nr:hypothetical protein [Colwellia sp.]